jgi:hypothetical protein
MNMNRVKDKWLAARIDEALATRVADYLTKADHLDSMGDFLRRAAREYMDNHPIKSGQSV